MNEYENADIWRESWSLYHICQLVGVFNGSKQSRLQQLVTWCGGEEFNGCLVFDECHKAKNFVPVGVIQSYSLFRNLKPVLIVLQCWNWFQFLVYLQIRGRGVWGFLNRFYLILVVLYFFKGKYELGVLRWNDTYYLHSRVKNKPVQK